ncbi:MAG: hypothetical protein U5K56_02300 [Halioglobus sp.]|nr:hypothetical protein [Halioglobus sp.]
MKFSFAPEVFGYPDTTSGYGYLRRKMFNYRQCIVGGTIVRNEHYPVGQGLSLNALDLSREEILAVERGKQDTDWAR